MTDRPDEELAVAARDGDQGAFEALLDRYERKIFNLNDAKVGDRQMHNIFAGFRTGRIAWLGEIDYIIDDGTPTGRRSLWTSLIEANIALKRGHNLKATFEYFDPDTDVSENQQNRLSLVWEYFPIQFFQTRLGYRRYDGIPQNPAQNREQLFLELHLLF